MCSRHVMTTCCPPSCPKIRFANFASLNVFVSATVLSNHVDKTSSQIPPGAKGNCTSLQPCDNNFARQKWAQTSIGKCLGNSEATKRLTRKTAMIGSVLKTCMPHCLRFEKMLGAIRNSSSVLTQELAVLVWMVWQTNAMLSLTNAMMSLLAKTFFHCKHLLFRC